MEEHVFICSDGRPTRYRLWLPPEDVEPKAFLQILHGMADHSRRYNGFASYMARHGIAVFCADMRGHGDNIVGNDPKGWVADEEGWSRLEDDAFELAYKVASEYAEGKSIYILGQSLGSTLARTVLAEHPFFYRGAILLGVSASMGVMGRLALAVGEGEIRKLGPRAQSKLMYRMMSERFNKPFKPADTDYEWLSRDASEVLRYVNDERCGFVCTTSFYRDALVGIAKANESSSVRDIPKYMPILVMCGGMDPVSDMGDGAMKVWGLYERAGLHDVKVRVFPGARHELLKETNRAEVIRMLASWLLEHVER